MANKDDEARGWVVIVVGCVTMSIALAILACRVFTRSVLVRQFGIDDWAAIVAGVMMLMCGTMVMNSVKHGLGRHAWTLDDATHITYQKYFYVSIIMYNAALVAVKMAFLLQYYRVFAVPKIRRIIIACMVLIASWSLSQLFVAIFTCVPIHKFWDRTMTTGHCIPTLPQWYINAGGNIITDVVIFLLPIPILKNINLRRSQKLMVMGIFSLGFFTVAISFIRVKYLDQLADHTWENVGSSCWSVAEVSSAVTCLCLPTLKPLLVRLRPRFGSSHGTADSRTDQPDRPPRSSVRGFFKHSQTSAGSTSHIRTRSDGTHLDRGGYRLSYASRHTRNTSQNTTLVDGTGTAGARQDGIYQDALDLGEHGRGRSMHAQSSFDMEAARRGYFLPPLPDWDMDRPQFPDSISMRDVAGMHGIVTTTIGTERLDVSDGELPEPPNGHIAVRREFQRESSPWPYKRLSV